MIANQPTGSEPVLSDRPADAAAETPEPEGPRRINATKDPSFARIHADVSFANFIGGDVDISLLLRQTVYRDILMGEEEQPTEVKGAKTIVEVGRLRMPADSATFLAFNILFACAREDLYDVAMFDMNANRIREAIIEAAPETGD
ncbi:MAG TPA: hypothetical protein VKI45_00070 [Allosphingosinicella sp.]|nr:hypothetical protein [Allosphingosinicella sp.]